MLPLADEEADRLLASIPDSDRANCWWLVLRDGTPVPGDRGGGLALFRELRLTHPIGRVLDALRLSPLIDAFDRLVSRYRGRLGRLVPDGPAPRRHP